MSKKLVNVTNPTSPTIKTDKKAKMSPIPGKLKGTMGANVSSKKLMTPLMIKKVMPAGAARNKPKMRVFLMNLIEI